MLQRKAYPELFDGNGVLIKPRLWTNPAGDHQMPLGVTKSSVPILTARARLLREPCGPLVTDPKIASILSPDHFDQVASIASYAGALTLRASRTARKKHDSTIVTDADLASEHYILAELGKLFPSIPIISEEAVAAGATQQPAARFWLVDPLDGTTEFAAGSDEFTVNIALIADGAPLAGWIGAPAFGRLYRGAVGFGAERFDLPQGAPILPTSARTIIRTRAHPPEKPVILHSRSHLDPATEAYVARSPGRRIACGSSLKFCMIAEGDADLYPRLAPVSEWDIAAGHAIVAAAGGHVTTPNGDPLTYGHIEQNFHVPGFIVTGAA